MNTVSEVELLKDVRDVCLDGRLADEELVRDLGVREATGQQAEDLALAFAELVEPEYVLQPAKPASAPSSPKRAVSSVPTSGLVTASPRRSPVTCQFPTGDAGT